MQKVEGSSPFIRSQKGPANRGLSSFKDRQYLALPVMRRSRPDRFELDYLIDA